MSEKTKRICFTDIRNDDTFFFDLRLLHEKEEMVQFLISQNPKKREKWKQAILQEKLFFIQIHYCGNCRHRMKDLEWHQKKGAILEFSSDLIMNNYIFTCSCYESDEGGSD